MKTYTQRERENSELKSLLHKDLDFRHLPILITERQTDRQTETDRDRDRQRGGGKKSNTLPP